MTHSQRLSEGRNEAVAEVVIDVFLDILRLEDLDEFLVGRVLFILLAGCDDIDIRRGIVFGREGGLGVEAGSLCVAGIDDRDRYVIQRTRELRRFELEDLEVLRVFCDITDDSLGRIGAFLQLEETLLIEEEERTAAVGRVVRDGDPGTVRHSGAR